MPTKSSLFLNSLSPDSRALLIKLATEVALPRGTVLYESGVIPGYAYLLTSGIASTITMTRSGDSAEVGMIGHEGVVGSLQLLGPAEVPAESMIQIDATALRIPLAAFRRLFQTRGDIRDRLLEFVQNEALTIMQIAGCHRLHGTEQRLARWLLMVQDRVESDQLMLTHSFLALMIGIRRPTLTLVARSLQERGILKLCRGCFTIVDRGKLEAIACECYETVHKLHTKLYKRPGTLQVIENKDELRYAVSSKASRIEHPYRPPTRASSR